MSDRRRPPDAFGFTSRDRGQLPTAQALAMFRAALRADGSYTDDQIHDLTVIALEGEIARDGLNVAPLDDAGHPASTTA